VTHYVHLKGKHSSFASREFADSVSNKTRSDFVPENINKKYIIKMLSPGVKYFDT
jgi:hypothetical protein